MLVHRSAMAVKTGVMGFSEPALVFSVVASLCSLQRTQTLKTTHAPCGSMGLQMEKQNVLLLHTTNLVFILGTENTMWGSGSFSVMQSCLNECLHIFIVMLISLTANNKKL